MSSRRVEADSQKIVPCKIGRFLRIERLHRSQSDHHRRTHSRIVNANTEELLSVDSRIDRFVRNGNTPSPVIACLDQSILSGNFNPKSNLVRGFFGKRRWIIQEGHVFFMYVETLSFCR